MRKDVGKIRKDLTGMKFGKLTVKRLSGFIAQGQNKPVSMWWCRCECGTEKEVKGTHLTCGATKSCGCYKPNKLADGEASRNVLIGGYCRHAKERGYSWGLSVSEFEQITQSDCFYCGAPPKQIAKSIRSTPYIYNGIDRVDNAKSYYAANCVACCKLCNWMKRDLSSEDFFSHIDSIFRRRKNAG